MVLRIPGLQCKIKLGRVWCEVQNEGQISGCVLVGQALEGDGKIWSWSALPIGS